MNSETMSRLYKSTTTTTLLLCNLCLGRIHLVIIQIRRKNDRNKNICHRFETRLLPRDNMAQQIVLHQVMETCASLPSLRTWQFSSGPNTDVVDRRSDQCQLVDGEDESSTGADQCPLSVAPHTCMSVGTKDAPRLVGLILVHTI